MDQLQSELTRREFTDWQLYFAAEPFGHSHSNFILATLCCLVANYMRDEDTQAFKPDDFIPKYVTQEEREAELDHERHVQADLAYVAAMVEAGYIKKVVH